MTAPARLILVHKQPTSARTRFLRYTDGVVAPDPFPKLSQVLGEEESWDDASVSEHPASLVRRVAEDIGLDAAQIKLETEFRAGVDTPQGVASIYLGRITTIDPPFDAAERVGAKFIAITEGRDLPPSELELLRRAYECVMD